MEMVGKSVKSKQASEIIGSYLLLPGKTSIKEAKKYFFCH
jgi:hypothetical protein